MTLTSLLFRVLLFSAIPFRGCAVYTECRTTVQKNQKNCFQKVGPVNGKPSLEVVPTDLAQRTRQIQQMGVVVNVADTSQICVVWPGIVCAYPKLFRSCFPHLDVQCNLDRIKLKHHARCLDRESFRSKVAVPTHRHIAYY